MSGEPKTEDGTLFKRVPVILRSWDGPNSRIGLELDLDQMPWGPFDALGKRLSLLLPMASDAPSEPLPEESKVERALRHVEHAADRCGEFAQLANGNQDLWLRSQETWEWIRKYLTSLWVETEVEGREVDLPPDGSRTPPSPPTPAGRAPSLPGAAATLRVAARALRSTPLAVWRENLDLLDPDAPTREEAVQTLLGVAKVLGGEENVPVHQDAGVQPGPPSARQMDPEPRPHADPGSNSHPHPGSDPVEEDPDQVSFDYAQGYDEGYQMGRRVGLALGARRSPGSKPRQG